MKKILITLAIIITMVLGASAQDGFFRESSGGGSRDTDMPMTPSGYPGQISGNFDAPLGSGLLIFTALGAGYALSRKRKLAN